MPRYTCMRRRGTHTGDAPPPFDFSVIGLQWTSDEETGVYSFTLIRPDLSPYPRWQMRLDTYSGFDEWSPSLGVYSPAEFHLEGFFGDPFPWTATVWLGDGTLPTRIGPFDVPVLTFP